MTDNPRCDDLDYPLFAECTIDLPLPPEDGLTLQAWRLVLSMDDQAAYSFPNDLGPGFVAIVWSGDVSFSNEEASCQAGDTVHRIVAVTGETTVSLSSGDSAELAIIGLVGSTEPAFDQGPICRNIGAIPSFGSTGNALVSVILRVLELDCPEIEVSGQSWDRPAYVLTTERGPRPATVSSGPRIDSSESDCAAGGDLRLVSIEAFTSLRFLGGRASNDQPAQPRVIVCDYVADGGPDQELGGCSWRCKGSLLG